MASASHSTAQQLPAAGARACMRTHAHLPARARTSRPQSDATRQSGTASRGRASLGFGLDWGCAFVCLFVHLFVCYVRLCVRRRSARSTLTFSSTSTSSLQRHAPRPRRRRGVDAPATRRQRGVNWRRCAARRTPSYLRTSRMLLRLRHDLRAGVDETSYIFGYGWNCIVALLLSSCDCC